MKYLLLTFIFVGALGFVGNAVGDEPDSQSHFEAWGIPQMATVTHAEARLVSGQGFVQYPHRHRAAYAASRSASALPGSFTNNFAEASGRFLAEATSGALSELNSSVSGAHHPEVGDPSGWHAHHGWLGFGHHPWGGTGNHQVNVGSNGFSYATRN